MSDDRAAFAAEPASGIDVAAPSDLAVDAGAPVISEVQASIPAGLVQAVIDWSRLGVPDEACGVVIGGGPAAEGGRALRFEPLHNAAGSPYRYLIDPQEQLRLLDAVDAAGESLWAIVHSHVASAAEPSRTDIEAALIGGQPAWPGSLYLICSLADPERPVVRAWSIDADGAHEVTLEVG